MERSQKLIPEMRGSILEGMICYSASTNANYTQANASELHNLKLFNNYTGMR